MQGYIDGVPSVFGSPPFTRGDFVVLNKLYYTGYRFHMNSIVRQVVDIKKSRTTASGWLVYVDGGKPCPCCGLTPANRLCMDSGWFQLANADNIENDKKEAERVRA